MARKGNVTRLIFLLGVLGLASGVRAAEVSVLGSCVGTIGAKGLLASRSSRAGSTYQSAQNQVLITVCNTSGNQAGWRVDIRRGDSEWPRGLRLWVRRTGDGIGGGLVTGCRTYQEIGPAFRTLLTGTGDRSSIPLQFKLTGVSMQTPIGTFGTSINYTIVETGG